MSTGFAGCADEGGEKKTGVKDGFEVFQQEQWIEMSLTLMGNRFGEEIVL